MAPELLERRERLEREKVELEEQWVANEKRSPETVGGKFEKPCVPLTPRGAARHIGPAGEYKEALGLLGPSPTGVRVPNRSVAYEMETTKTEMRHQACLRTG